MIAYNCIRIYGTFLFNVIISYLLATSMIASSSLHKRHINQLSVHAHTAQVLALPFSAQSSANNSIHQSLPTSSENRNHYGHISNRPQLCQFKIRTFTTKTVNKNSSLQGKQICDMLVIDGGKKHTPQNRQDMYNMIINKCSQAEDCSKDSIRQKYKIIINQKKKNKETAIFNQIEIFKTLERNQLRFHQYNFSQLLPISHKPDIRFNQLRHSQLIESSKVILLFSFKLINLQTKKYGRQHQRGYFSQKNVQSEKTNEFLGECANLLKLMSGQQTKQSFLKNCQLFYKVDNQLEMNLLQEYLIQHQLHHFAGIVNIQTKHTESFNLYSLRAISKRNAQFIIIDDQKTLNNELPIFEGEKVSFITPKIISYATITQLIRSLKQACFQTKQISPAKSCNSRKSPYNKNCYQRNQDVQKENISPNLGHWKMMKNVSKQQNNNINETPSKRNQIFRQAVIISGNIRQDKINYNYNLLTLKAKQCLQIKQIRQILKGRRNNSSGDRDCSAQRLPTKKTSRDKSINKNKDQQYSHQQSAPRFSILDGEFKQKLVTFTKILQNQKLSKCEVRKQRIILNEGSSYQGKNIVNEGKKQMRQNNEDLQDLTLCLTSKNKSKTPYQLVGDLIRNNTHISRQVGKYLQLTAPVAQFIRKIQTNQTNLLQKFDKSNIHKLNQLIINYY